MDINDAKNELSQALSHRVSYLIPLVYFGGKGNGLY